MGMSFANPSRGCVLFMALAPNAGSVQVKN